MVNTISKDKSIEYSLWRIWAYGTMIFFTVLTIAPLVWLFYSSFKTNQDIVKNLFRLPESLYIENYIKAWKLGKLGLYTVNSIIYASVSTLVTTMLALMAGYGFAKFGYKISTFLHGLFIIGLLITAHTVLIPLFLMETRLGIANTHLGVIIPYVAFGLPFQVFLATSYIRGIPSSLEEAGIIDGADYLTIFWKIIVPMATPVAATMIIFSFLSNWNEFVFVFVLTSKDTVRSLPVGINAFAGGRTRDYGLQFAALVIGTLPMILFYVVFHKQLAKGFSAGSLKE